MKEFILHVVGYAIIWSAIQMRRGDNQIRLFSKDWWVALVLVALGSILLQSD